MKINNKTGRLFYLLSICIFTNSCISVIPSKKVKYQQLDKNNIDTINGTYYNLPTDKAFCDDKSLWSLFNFKLIRQYDTLLDYNNYYVRLNVINNKRIKAELIRNGEIVAKKTIKGKFKNNSFSINRKVRVVGIPFIYFFTRDYKTQIQIDTNGNLIIGYAESWLGLIFIMSGGDDNYCSYKFKRKE